MPIKLNRSGTLSEALQIAARDGKQPDAAAPGVLRLSEGALVINEGPAGELNKKNKAKLKAAILTLVENEIEASPAGSAKTHEERRNIADAALQTVLSEDGYGRIGVQTLRKLAGQVAQLEGAVIPRPNRPLPSAAKAAEAKLGVVLGNQSPAHGGSSSAPRDSKDASPLHGTHLRQVQQLALNFVQSLLRGGTLSYEERSTYPKTLREHPEACGPALDEIVRHIAFRERTSGLPGAASMPVEGIARALVVLPHASLSGLQLSAFMFEKVNASLSPLLADGSSAAARNQPIRERLRLKAKAKGDQAVAAEFDIARKLELLKKNATASGPTSLSAPADSKAARPAPDESHSPSSAIELLADELEKQADRDVKANDAALAKNPVGQWHAFLREMQVEQVMDMLLDGATSSDSYQQAVDAVAHNVRADRGLAEIAADQFEMHIERVEVGLRYPHTSGPDRYRSAAQSLCLIPLHALEHVYIDRSVVDQISYWHEGQPTSAEHRRLQKQVRDLEKSVQNAFGPDEQVGPLLEKLRSNADRFEKFLETELAQDHRFDHVDRAILIHLAEEAGLGPRHPQAADEAEDASALPHSPEAEVQEIPAPGVQKPAAPDDEGDKSREGGGGGRGGRRPGVGRAAPLVPNLNRGPGPVRPKRQTSHHDAGKAKWRSKRQRDVFGRAGKSRNHQQAVEALRAMRAQADRKRA